MTVMGFVLCAGLGWYGAVKTFRFWAGKEKKPIVFTAWGGGGYMAVSALCYLLYLWAERAAAESSLALIPVLIVLPMLVFPYGIYFAGLAVACVSTFFSPLGSMEAVHSYDKGDAAMTRRDFKAAEAFYRKDISRWPEDTQAVIRLARALEEDGRASEAAIELGHAREKLLKATGGAKKDLDTSATENAAKRRERNEGIMALTYYLGDLYVGALQKPDEARAVYEETLERLYGFSGVDPLRDRLKSLAC